MSRYFGQGLVCFALVATFYASVVDAGGIGDEKNNAELFLRGKEKSVKGITIVSESPAGIAYGGGQTKVAAEDIVEIVYDFQKVDHRQLFKAGIDAEKNANDGDEAKRKTALAEAAKKFGELDVKLLDAKAAESKASKRHVKYKLANLAYRQALEPGGNAKSAIQELQLFTNKHKDGWQAVHAYRALAHLYVAQGDLVNAGTTYTELAELPTASPTVKLDAKLSAAQLSVRAGNVDEALKNLKGIEAELPPDSPLRPRVKVAEAQCLVATKKLDNAKIILQDVVKTSKDPQVKAAAHNALGEALFQQEKWKEARWEFLWVDVTYNQDPGEHAKALYYLWKCFINLNDAPRAQETLQVLLNDPRFAGFDFQAKARKESTK